MAIKRRGGSSSRSKPAPARAPAPAPAPARSSSSSSMQRSAPHPPAPAPAAAPQTPAAPTSGGGGFLANAASGIFQGMTFGVGSSMAHRAVDAIMGPRQVEHVHTGQDQQQQQQPQAQPTMMQQQPMMQQQQPMANSNACSLETENFQRCMQLNNNMIDQCSNYMQNLQQCQASGRNQ